MYAVANYENGHKFGGQGADWSCLGRVLAAWWGAVFYCAPVFCALSARGAVLVWLECPRDPERIHRHRSRGLPEQISGPIGVYHFPSGNSDTPPGRLRRPGSCMRFSRGKMVYTNWAGNLLREASRLVLVYPFGAPMYTQWWNAPLACQVSGTSNE